MNNYLNNRLFRALPIVLVGFIALPLCRAAQPTGQTLIKIGHVAPLSGPIAHIGKEMENSAHLAVDELNAKAIVIHGQKVRFILVPEDDAGEPKQSGPVAQKLVDAQVNAVIGHATSGTAIPAAKVYASAGIPQIATTVTATTFTAMGIPTAFRLIANDGTTGVALGHYAIATLHAKTIAVIDDRTAYGEGIADTFVKTVKADHSIKQPIQRHFTTDKATDFNAILTSIKASQPDVIFLGGMDVVAAPLLRQMKALKISSKLIAGDGACTDQLIKFVGDAMNPGQMICAVAGSANQSPDSAMDHFKDTYRKKFGLDVSIYGPYIYDAVMTFADAMQQAQSAAPSVYLPFLRKIHHQGLTGMISFDNKGDLLNPTVSLYTFEAGKRILLEVNK